MFSKLLDSRFLPFLIFAALLTAQAATGAGIQLSVNDSPWTAEGSAVGQKFGQFLNSAGDVNGDDYEDFIVSSQSASGNAGRAWLFYGGPAGPGTTPDVTFTPPADVTSSHYFGMHARAAGDVNNDGYADIMIGCTGCDAPGGAGDEGMVYVYHGADGAIDTNYDWRARGVLLYSHLGWAGAPAGDVNGDNYDDILVGAYRYDANTVHHAYLFLGSSTGLDQEGTRAEGTPSNCDWSASGEQSLDAFGLTLGTAGDLNDDGYDDIFVGAQDWDGAQPNVGKIWVWYGSSSWPTSPDSPATADWSAEGTIQTDRFGGAAGYEPGAAAAGDVDGDGYDDFLIGCYACDVGATNNGSVALWYGSDTGLTDGPPDWEAAGLHEGDILGFTVTSAGDFNQDGYSDFLVSQPGWDKVWDPNNQTNEGRGLLWLGSPQGPLDQPLPIYADCLIPGDQAGGNLGYSLAAALDVDDDGFDDLVLGTEWFDNDHDINPDDNRGKIYFFPGLGVIGADDFESNDLLRWTLATP